MSWKPWKLHTEKKKKK